MIDKEEILQNTDVLIKIDKEDVTKLDREVTEGEVPSTLKKCCSWSWSTWGGFLQSFLEIL